MSPCYTCSVSARLPFNIDYVCYSTYLLYIPNGELDFIPSVLFLKIIWIKKNENV